LLFIYCSVSKLDILADLDFLFAVLSKVLFFIIFFFLPLLSFPSRCAKGSYKAKKETWNRPQTIPFNGRMPRKFFFSLVPLQRRTDGTKQRLRKTDDV